MPTFITDYVQEIASISAAVSALLAFFGLIYVGLQFGDNTKSNQYLMYLKSLDRYHSLRKMLIEDEELAEIYDSNFKAENMTAKQRYYIYCLLAFCEGLYLTRQVYIFPEIRGGSWKNFIKHSLAYPAIQSIWQEEKSNKESSDFADDFIEFADKL